MQKNVYLIGGPLWFFTSDNIILYFLTILDYMCLVSVYIFSSTMHTIKRSLFLKTWNKSLRTQNL